MEKKVIAIGRQFGSGGHTVGVMVAEKLGIPCYDKDILDRIAQESGYDLDFVKQLDEAETMTRHRISDFFTGRDNKGNSIEDYVWEAQKSVVKKIADEGPCVIIGRCADFLLSDRDDTLTVFVHAPYKDRELRILEKYGESELEIEKRIEQKDQRRAAKYMKHTKRAWGMMENYDLCLNSAKLGVQGCVNIITRIVEASQGCYEPPTLYNTETEV